MKSMRVPWTQEEINNLIPRLDSDLKEIEESEDHEVKGLPPMTQEEAMDYLKRLAAIAAERPWTSQEVFLHGQLLSVFQQANYAFSRGYKGRFFVIPEDLINDMMKRQG